MNHLTGEQFEEILMTGRDLTGHVDSCARCRTILTERQALRDRVKVAFDRLSVPSDLADRIRLALSEGSASPAIFEPTRRRIFNLPPAAWIVGSAVAAVLAIGFLLNFRFGTLPIESTAEAQLVQIHESNLNLTAHSPMFSGADPVKLAAYLQSQLGYAPKPPRSSPTATLRGCCVRKFCMKRVACYILDTPGGRISIVAIENHPKTFGMNRQTSCARCDKCTCWKKSFGKVNAVATQVGQFSFYALGDLPQDKLASILMSAYPTLANNSN